MLPFILSCMQVIDEAQLEVSLQNNFSIAIRVQSILGVPVLTGVLLNNNRTQ